MGTDREMPKYRCHKEVNALKIAIIVHDPGNAKDRGAIITPVEGGYVPFRVDHEYLRKHNPQIGGYYVVYKDGYKSYSPAKAFRDGYALIR